MKQLITTTLLLLTLCYNTTADSPLPTTITTNQPTQTTTQPTPQPPPEKKGIQIGDSKNIILSLLGKPTGNMQSKNWEILLYPQGEIELKNGKVVKNKLRTPEQTALKNQKRDQRIADKKQKAQQRKQNAKKRKETRAKTKKENQEKADKKNKEWKEKITKQLGKKPSISSKKRKRLKGRKRWYWNPDGTINWEAVKANPPPDPEQTTP